MVAFMTIQALTTKDSFVLLLIWQQQEKTQEEKRQHKTETLEEKIRKTDPETLEEVDKTIDHSTRSLPTLKIAENKTMAVRTPCTDLSFLPGRGNTQ